MLHYLTVKLFFFSLLNFAKMSYIFTMLKFCKHLHWIRFCIQISFWLRTIRIWILHGRHQSIAQDRKHMMFLEFVFFFCVTVRLSHICLVRIIFVSNSAYQFSWTEENWYFLDVFRFHSFAKVSMKAFIKESQQIQKGHLNQIQINKQTLQKT